MPTEISIREIEPTSREEVELVASRMRQTLVEVLGEKRGGDMDTPEWLIKRVEWHLDPSTCTGQVFLATLGDEVLGHTIVRLDIDFAEQPIGLFSTIFVIPEARGLGIAKPLVSRGEAWMSGRSMDKAVAYTDENNLPLINLFKACGYNVSEVRNEFAVLNRDLP